MNKLDCTLKLGYISGGAKREFVGYIYNNSCELSYKIGEKGKAENASFDSLTGLTDGVITVDISADNCVRIDVAASEPVEFTMAELIYDRYYEQDELFFANGYQSWTTSREYGRGDTQCGLRTFGKFPIMKKFAGASGDYDFTEYGKGLYHSFTYTYLRRGESVELVGSLDERTGYTIFYADMSQNVFAVVKDVEGLKFSGSYTLFDLFFAEGDYDGVFDSYFEAHPKKHTGRIQHLAGYTSWYNYYQNINEEIILRDLEGLKRAEGANIFQIDDGYETKIGDWELDSKKFPHDLSVIVDKIHEQGLLAGLWVAPFAAQFSAEIIKKHPEWLICDKKGKPLISGIAWGGFYALDIELPEVREYIKGVFDKVFNKWHFDLVKLDFLYAAAIIPRNGKTRGQLMCEAMEFLRECCGDKLILGCGVPLGPSFGIVDACRIGCDAETRFKDRFYVKLTNQEIISTRNAMNNAVFRRHLNGRIMANDPDVFFLRRGGMKPARYTMQQKQLLAKVNQMFGDVLFVSDNVGEYDDEQLSILNKTYKKFAGKVKSACYSEGDRIRIEYEINGEERTLIFDTFTGDSGEL